MFEATRKVGPVMTFISSDSGLTGALNYPDALAMAAKGIARAASPRTILI